MFHAVERLFAAAEYIFADSESVFGGGNRMKVRRSAEIFSPAAQPYLTGWRTLFYQSAGRLSLNRDEISFPAAERGLAAERTLFYQSAGRLSLNGDEISFPAAECGLTEIGNLCNPSRRTLVGRMRTDGFTRL